MTTTTDRATISTGTALTTGLAAGVVTACRKAMPPRWAPARPAAVTTERHAMTLTALTDAHGRPTWT